ncbi:putative ATP-binding cassette family ATPase CAF16 [Ascoidea rubescens DSM 1968]|uniref:Putative CCR4-NOT complex associated factor Caf16p n=1 Tax=Ascoidea rubescens DSM 1968 TaxID=1344418 RepID=A0A1D2VKJ8_9ASCO|nr:putative CCR4-NOT complex associated factor Caf16p [Ascoidea rubescens DSM 1968]ODV62130.1 putative CCR4-NOT complex associated factor Caf16p [Ascoidea rubescens DSM 1968]
MSVDNKSGKDAADLGITSENLTYIYPSTGVTGLADVNINLPWNSRTLLIGPNGAGKSTLLRLLAGKTLAKFGSIRIGGYDPFRGGSDAQGITTYLGTEWASNPVVRRDMSVLLLINSVGGDNFPEKRDELIELLDINLNWKMNNVSDGERRRVQLVMGLLKPWTVLLLDEVTVDLDVLVRARLIAFLKKETLTRKCCIVYATHIFDGLSTWPTHVIHMSGGKVLKNLEIGKSLIIDDKTHNISKQERIKLEPVYSIHPLALNWLVQDLVERGSREEEKNRPTWEELKKKFEHIYFDQPDRVGEYFSRNRRL